MKRVVTLDVLRGIAIFVVILSHVFIYVVGYSILNPQTGSLIVLIFLAPLIFLGKWKGFFLMISAASQIYSMNKDIRNENNAFIVFLKQILNASLLLVVAYFFKVFLLPGATLYQYIFYSIWDPSSRLSSLQFSDTLESIALCRIINAVIYYLITLGKGIKKPYRNIAIFGILGFLSIVLTPVVVQLVFNQTGLTPLNIRTTIPNTWEERLYLIFMGNLIGWQQPLFPFISSAFFGAIYGIIFTQETLPEKKFIHTAFLTSLGFVIGGLGLLPFTEDIIADFWTHIHEPWMLFVNLGIQSMCFLFFMRLIEFNPNNAKIVRRLRFFRRFGMLSLSIFCLELVDLFPRWVFSKLFDQDFVTGTTTNIGLLFALVVFTLAFWSVIIRLWEFARFYGSLEWFLRMFMCLLFNKKPNFNDPLNSRQILYEVEPILLLSIP
ncbi:MAG: hypothetical protein JW776_12200 [Candidatus Lokiarchaeota archaeon]|nr:hypothetical protein [Candidatus Lokiarchaeota archaeon]